MMIEHRNNNKFIIVQKKKRNIFLFEWKMLDAGCMKDKSDLFSILTLNEIFRTQIHNKSVQILIRPSPPDKQIHSLPSHKCSCI